MEKKEFHENLDYYIEFLLSDREEIFESEMISNFHYFRERIDRGLKEHKISHEKNILLMESDLAYMKDIKDILVWWDRDNIYFIRNKYKDRITREMWYWWIDDIVKGEYPVVLIPEYLQEEVNKYYKK